MSGGDVPHGTEALRWKQPDAFHICTDCGRFTVARMTVGGVDWYIAHYRAGVNGSRALSIELGATRVAPRSSDAERRKAIRDMQALCEAAASEESGAAKRAAV